MRKEKIIIAVILVTFSIIMYTYSFSWESHPYSIVYPRMLLLSLIILSILYAISKESKEKINHNNVNTINNYSLKKTNIARVTMGGLSILVYIILIPLLGFYIATAIFLLVLLYIYGKIKKFYLLITSIVIFLFLIYGIFVYFLKVPIP